MAVEQPNFNFDFWELLVQEWADGDLRNIVPPVRLHFCRSEV
eukprot:SAG31_NODE_883_length_11260_cov_38.912284_2_plen_42_part_00